MSVDQQLEQALRDCCTQGAKKGFIPSGDLSTKWGPVDAGYSFAIGPFRQSAPGEVHKYMSRRFPTYTIVTRVKSSPEYVDAHYICIIAIPKSTRRRIAECAQQLGATLLFYAAVTSINMMIAGWFVSKTMMQTN